MRQNLQLFWEAKFILPIHIYKYPKRSIVVNIDRCFSWRFGKKQWLLLEKRVKNKQWPRRQGGKLEQAHNRSGIAISLKSTLLSLDAYRSDKMYNVPNTSELDPKQECVICNRIDLIFCKYKYTPHSLSFSHRKQTKMNCFKNSLQI